MPSSAVGPLAAAGVLMVSLAAARELHVSPKGPLKTISAAAEIAQPGDTITVHSGIYRERVTPPRGGVVYRAAPGERVEIKGSEIVTGWTRTQNGVWKVSLPNSFFGAYNPYKDLIEGDWFDAKGRQHHTGEIYLNGAPLAEAASIETMKSQTWFTDGAGGVTHLYADFGDKDPNRELVEINVRESCFYPSQPGVNSITVRGFVMRHAATQWAAPTAEQIGLIGTHYSKGWIIEDNEISDSRCSCITLGKDRATGHNVWNANRAIDGATHYNQVIERALQRGWSRETVGSHIVRNNTIHRCEQAGIAGSLGAIWSRIYNNDIYDIWRVRQFGGAEMAGIKLHAAIDVVISNNRIHNAGRGLWMDWMAQGTRITRNLLYDNTTDDLFVEVNHGPFMVDNNLFLSKASLTDWSEGGAYAHNLFAGAIVNRQELKRSTPYHKAHSTQLAGLHNTEGGDNRFFNNIFLSPGGGLAVYDAREAPLLTGGNVYCNGAQPYKKEAEAVVNCGLAIALHGDKLKWSGPPAPIGAPVTADRLGKTKISGLPYKVTIDTDYSGVKRGRKPKAGPFEKPVLVVWPNQR